MVLSLYIITKYKFYQLDLHYTLKINFKTIEMTKAFTADAMAFIYNSGLDGRGL